jgi:hypothetical protein
VHSYLVVETAGISMCNHLSVPCRYKASHLCAQVLQQLASQILPLLEPYLLGATEAEQAAVVAPEQGMLASDFPACNLLKPPSYSPPNCQPAKQPSVHASSSCTDDDLEERETVDEEDVLEAQPEAGKEARSIQRGAAAAARRAQLRRQEVSSIHHLACTTSVCIAMCMVLHIGLLCLSSWHAGSVGKAGSCPGLLTSPSICGRVCVCCGPGSWPSWDAVAQQPRRLHAQLRCRCLPAAQLPQPALLPAARRLKRCCSGISTAGLASCCLSGTLVGFSCGWTPCSRRYSAAGFHHTVPDCRMVSPACCVRPHTSSFRAAVQIARIAEHGADRAARVAACEFLHATTMWMVGEPCISPKPACCVSVFVGTIRLWSASCGPQ